MEGNGLAAQTMALLGPYLAAAGRGVAAQVGRDIWGQFCRAMERLYASVKGKFATNSEAAENLSRLAKEPQSQGRQGVVKEVLSQFIQEDPQFAKELRKLVEDARLAGGDTIIQTVTVSGGNVGDITQVGKQIEGRD